MLRFYLFLSILTFSISNTYAQGLDSLSLDAREFIVQMKDFMTSNKMVVMEDLFNQFEEQYKSGLFTQEEFLQIRQTCNGMLDQRMSASTYFRFYIQGLLLVKQSENGAKRFMDWHGILDDMLANIENRRVKPYQDFLNFSASFFEHNAIRYSSTGVSWIADAPDYEMAFEEGIPILKFDQLNLISIRQTDSIEIKQTQGTFFPTLGIFKGEGGRVTWERYGLGASVYAELGVYEIEVIKSIYACPEVTLYYPLFFGGKGIKGSFEDKLSSLTTTNSGSYPRFESFQEVLEINNLGKGIRYRGGFRINGTTIYGYGSKNSRAAIRVFNENEELIFKALAELFTIRQEERIAGEGVESTIYFDQDSLYHPSVNLRFEIPKGEVQLSRGQRGSDQNPFYSSVHQLNLAADKLNYYIEKDSILIGEKSLVLNKSNTPVVFESLEYFNHSEYHRVQNIATYNPIAVIKAVAEREGNILEANYLASKMDSRYTVENIKSLIYDLVSKGFISYDADKEEIEVKDKIFHYANASQQKVDYDVLRIQSETSETNASFNLKNKTIVTNGVSNIEFSRSRNVGIKPFGDQVVIKENRDMELDGRLFAGKGILTGKDYSFEYERFQIIMDSVRYFDLFLETGNQAEGQEPDRVSIGSRIEHLEGVLLIDAPSNKSGTEKIEMFPSLQSKDYSYVYYDKEETLNSVYQRDSFYFQLDPFSFNGLDRYKKEDLAFKGTLVSAEIFPDIRETIVLMEEDQSLGFVTETPAEGLPNYTGKGNYVGTLTLSNAGFMGNGTLTYLRASINSEDVIFRPKQLTASAEEFVLEEGNVGPVEVPQAEGNNVLINWLPYRDSMYVTSTEKKPFKIYKDDLHTLDGTLILTPSGLKARGTFSWDKAIMTSQLFSMGKHSVFADTTSIKIKSFDAKQFALSTGNLNGTVNFDEQVGRFKSNANVAFTTLPYNQYVTTMDEFDWDMALGHIEFRISDGEYATFTSIHPDQDSLRFQGKTAEYQIENSELVIGGVPYIVSADAYVYPVDKQVVIKPQGNMDTLYNAKIVADTLSSFHVINRATVKIKGKKDFTGSGFYEYNVGPHVQEIEFQDIVGQRVGKGSRAEKRVATRATGEVTPKDNFYIDNKTEFRGKISLSSETKNLTFNGFARLDAELQAKHWFSVDFEGDRSDLSIRFENPKNYQGEEIKTGLFLSKETARIYPRVMAPLYFRKDRPLLPITGLFNYDETKDQFVFGDSLRVVNTDELKGNKLIFHNKTGKIEGDGRFNLGEGLEYISIDAAGAATTNIEVSIDTTLGGPLTNSSLMAEFMLGINLILPEELRKQMITDIESSSFEAQGVVYASDPAFYQRAVANLFGDNSSEMKEVIGNLPLNTLDLPKKQNKYTFLFSKVPMKWDPDYQSFVSTEEKLPLASVDGNMVNRKLTCYIECKMPTDDDDRLYIYLKSPSGFYYFFGYKQGILNIVSSNPTFNDAVINMKDKDRVVKMGNGKTYEIQPVNPGTAQSFVSRVQAVQ